MLGNSRDGDVPSFWLKKKNVLQLFAESCQDSFPACSNRSEKTVPGHLEVNWGLFWFFLLIQEHELSFLQKVFSQF